MKPGRYRHYKGKYYRVLGVALDVVKEQKVVLYNALYPCPELTDEYGDTPVFSRPYDMFFEKVMVDGREIPRFEYAGE